MWQLSTAGVFKLAIAEGYVFVTALAAASRLASLRAESLVRFKTYLAV